MQLDKKDKQILNLIQEDARLNTKQIAHKVGLTVTPTYERIKRIEKAGFIKRFAALVNRKKVEKNLIVFCSITLQQHSKLLADKLELIISDYDEVMECYHIAGAFDYLLKIAVRDMEEYQSFLKNKLTTIEKIGMINSSFVMSEVKHTTAFKLK